MQDLAALSAIDNPKFKLEQSLMKKLQKKQKQLAEAIQKWTGQVEVINTEFHAQVSEELDKVAFKEHEIPVLQME